MIVSAPASSANLGPGFDCLGLAVELPFELATVHPGGGGWLEVESTHPAAVAFVAAGGEPGTPLWWRSPIPPGRGLGFSGAARVAGAYLAARLDELDHDQAREAAARLASQLEGHADNAVASALGGFTLVAGEEVATFRVPEGLELFAWWPDRSISTDRSRSVLPEAVPLEDAAFSIARTALWVAAMAAGDTRLLRSACQDRVHQPARLASLPDSAEVLEHLLGHREVVAAWLSGSGPTVAALVECPAGAPPLDAGLPVEGRHRRLALSPSGVCRHDA